MLRRFIIAGELGELLLRRSDCGQAHLLLARQAAAIFDFFRLNRGAPTTAPERVRHLRLDLDVLSFTAIFYRLLHLVLALLLAEDLHESVEILISGTLSDVESER